MTARIALSLAVLAAGAAAQTTVLHCDFEHGLPPELVPGSGAVTGVQGFAGLGPAGNYFAIEIDGNTCFRESFANALPNQFQSYVPPAGVELAHRVDLDSAARAASTPTAPTGSAPTRASSRSATRARP
jgi:hypothetical protein